MDAKEVPVQFWPDLLVAERARKRYEQTGESTALDIMVASWESILGAPTFADSSKLFREFALHHAGGSHLWRFENSGDLENLNLSLACFEQLVALTGPGSPDLAEYLSSLGIACRHRYLRSGEFSFLERAVTAWQAAVEIASSGSDSLPSYLSHLGLGLMDRYLATGSIADLDRSIAACERSVAEEPDSARLPSHRNNLALALRLRYELGSRPEDLRRAVDAWEQAIEETPFTHPNLPRFYNNLGIGRHAQFHYTGDLAYLEMAVSAYRQAVLRTPPDSPDRGRHLSNLSTGFKTRFERTEQIEDLFSAVEADEQAVAATPASSPDFPMQLNNLSSSLRELHARTGDLANLEGAIRCCEQAVELTPESSPERALYLASLATSLDDRFAETGDPNDLDRSIQLFEEAIERTPAESPRLPINLTNLGVALSRRLRRTGSEDDQKWLEEVWRKAEEVGLGRAPESVLYSARNRAAWAFEHEAWKDAAGACDEVIEAAERLFLVQVARPGKASWLRELRHVPGTASYAHARSGDLTGAVIALERGRVRLLQEALDFRQADLEVLQREHPDLARRYREAAVTIVRLEDAQAPVPPLQTPAVEPARAARDALSTVLEEIRHLPGHESFLLSADLSEVRSALELLPEDAGLIYLVATWKGSMALLATRKGMEVQWLEVTQNELSSFLYDRPERRGYLSSLFEPAKLELVLKDALPLLGESIMGPVADRLRAAGIHHAIIIPTGNLGVLPLHAARYEGAGGSTWFLDEFTVSYATSARSLSGSLRGVKNRHSEPFLIGVTNPLYDEGSLPGTAFELDEIAQLFGEARRILGSEAATRVAVLTTLREGTHLHFACHGFFSPEEPLESGLRLSGSETLTLRDLLRGQVDLPRARLAVLSACQTAVSDFRDLPDEFIGLPAGFLQAGVPGVVGSLWPVDDLATALVMVKFYENLFLEGSSIPMAPARALCRAQRWLRDLTEDELSTYLQAHPYLESASRRRSSRLLSGSTTSRGEDSRESAPFRNLFDCWAPFLLIGV